MRMKMERKRKMLEMGVSKGTKPRLSHSKFGINSSKEQHACYYTSLPQVELKHVLSSGNIFKAYENQDLSNPILLEMETSTPTEPKPTNNNNNNLVLRDRAVISSPILETFPTFSKDEPRMKHHLEQVFIRQPPINKTT